MSASISVSSKDISTNAATATCTCDKYDLPKNVDGSWIDAGSSSTDKTQVETQSKTSTGYSDIVYKWNFGKTGRSVTHTFTGLDVGQSNPINCSVTVTCTKRITTSKRTRSRSWIEGTPAQGEPGKEGYVPATPGKWGDWSEWKESSSEKTETHTIAGPLKATKTVWTQPKQFSWSGDISFNSIIEFELSASDWKLLRQTAEKRANWRNQNGNANYSDADVKSKNFISAGKYNKMAGYCGNSDRVTSKKTVIKASLFHNLVTAVNRS